MDNENRSSVARKCFLIMFSALKWMDSDSCKHIPALDMLAEKPGTGADGNTKIPSATSIAIEVRVNRVHPRPIILKGFDIYTAFSSKVFTVIEVNPWKLYLDPRWGQVPLSVILIYHLDHFLGGRLPDYFF
jgi:hypothetical protein